MMDRPKQQAPAQQNSSLLQRTASAGPTIESGTRVSIYAIPTSGLPREEGQARIIECIDAARDLYRVRFEDRPEVVRVRVVIAEWQRMSKDQVLAPLLAHWGAHLSRAAFGDIDYGAATVPAAGASTTTSSRSNDS